MYVNGLMSSTVANFLSCNHWSAQLIVAIELSTPSVKLHLSKGMGAARIPCKNVTCTIQNYSLQLQNRWCKMIMKNNQMNRFYTKSSSGSSSSSESSSSDDSSDNLSDNCKKAAGKAATPVQLRGLTRKDWAFQQQFLNPKQLPTAEYRANKSAKRVNSQFVYYHVFTSFASHKLPENIDGLRSIIMSVTTTVSSLSSVTSNPFSQ